MRAVTFTAPGWPLEAQELGLACAEFCVALRDCALKVPRLEHILMRRREKMRTFTAGGVTITAPQEESIAAER